MTWHLTLQLALFIIALPLFAALGYQRGWRRELFLIPFVLGAVLFLAVNEGQNLANAITQLLLDQPHAVASSKAVFVVNLASLALIIALGYLLGNRIFPKPATPQDRALGIFPALITGFLAMFYLTNFVFPTSKTLMLGQGFIQVDQSHIGFYILVLFVIIAIILVIRLVTASAGKKK